MATLAVLGTLDTKGVEHAFVADQIRARGHRVLLIDAGSQGEPQVKPDIGAEAVAAAAGASLSELRGRADRGEAVRVMSSGAAVLVSSLLASRAIDGIISLGGSGGTAIGTAAMRALPVGFPKVMVSTLAASPGVEAYVGVKDLVMIPSVTDIAGLNRISRLILARAAGALCGMVEATPPAATDRPVVVASMFGNTTACVTRARSALEAAGYEVLVFHATGTGGRAMESLVESGLVAGVLDITTTEWADEWVGGILGAGPTRLEAAARGGVPAVVAPGCLDMVNFGPPDTVPEKFKGRTFYAHSPAVTLMRTTPAECAQLGRILAEKLNASTGPLTVLWPGRGLSVIGAEGGPFHDPAADAALLSSLQSALRSNIGLKVMDCAINDAEFADTCAAALLGHLRFAEH